MNITFDHVSVALGGTEIVHDVSLEVPSGQFLALLGPNGCGKSTLLRALYRVLRPSSGSIRIDGDDVHRLSARQAAVRMSVMAQESSQEFPMTAREVALLGRVPHQRGFGADSEEDLALVEDALQVVGAGALGQRYFSGLSGGEKQRVLLARALVQNSPVLILDEPTNHLDISFQLELMQLVAARGLTTIAALHDMNLAAEFCDSVAVLQGGRLLAHGAPEKVLTSELIRTAFNVRSHMLEHPLTGKTLIAVSAPEPHRAAGRTNHLIHAR